MKGAKSKPSAPKKDPKDLSKKADETNLKKRKQLAPKDDKGKKRQSKKERKAAKDPNKPKRPPSAFFVFLAEFRTTFNAENPHNKSVSAVGKAGGDKWKSMGEADKAPYVAKANKKKAEYEKAIQAYNSKQAQAADDVGAEESDKSKSEINDDDEEGSEEEVEEEDDD